MLCATLNGIGYARCDPSYSVAEAWAVSVVGEKREEILGLARRAWLYVPKYC